MCWSPLGAGSSLTDMVSERFDAGVRLGEPPRTWSPFGSGRTCAWPWSALRAYFAEVRVPDDWCPRFATIVEALRHRA